MRFRDVLYLVNASLRCLLHIETIIFSCYLPNSSSQSVTKLLYVCFIFSTFML